MKKRSLRERFYCFRDKYRERAVALHMRAVFALYGANPIPLWYWRTIRTITRCLIWSKDPLTRDYKRFQGTGVTLQDAGLRQVLNTDLLGVWALDPKTIDFLWSRLQKERPQSIIEFGAGTSTVVLAKYAQWLQANAQKAAKAASFEQDAAVCRRTQERLENEKIDARISVLHTPLTAKFANQFESKQVWAAIDGRPLDWIIIDGPSGPPGCRQATLPSLLPFCRPGTRWFLDDALRDGELAILLEWSNRLEIKIEGIYPFGKGLATGIIVSTFNRGK